MSELPPGFVLDPPPAPSLPAGFVLDAPPSGASGIDEAGMEASFPSDPAAEFNNQVTRNRQVVLGGIARGAEHAAFAIPDIAAGLVNAGLTGSNAVFGTDFGRVTPPSTLYERGAAKIGMPVPPPLTDMTPNEKLQSQMADYGTQALAFGGIPAAIAPARAAKLAEGAAPKVGDALLQPYFKNPARTLAGDVAGGIGSGAGVNYVDEHTDPNSKLAPLAQFGGAFLGGVGGTAALNAAELAARGASALGRKFADMGRSNPSGMPGPVDPETLRPYSRNEVKAAAARVQGMANNPATAQQRIGESAASYRDENLPVPTTGIISGDVGMIGGEKAARTANADKFIQHDNMLRATATDKLHSLQDPGADQGAVPKAAESHRQTVLDPFEQRVKAAETALASATAENQARGAPLAARGNAEAKAGASGALDTSVVDQGYIPARAEKNRLFETAPGRNEQLPTDEVAAAAARVRAQNNTLRPDNQLPEEFVQRIEALSPKMEQSSILDASGRPVTKEVNVGGPGTASGADLADTRKYISTAIARAESGGNFDLASSLKELRSAINKTLGEAPGYSEANANYQDFAARYRPTQGDEAAKFTREIDREPGRGNTPPSETAGRFLSSPEKAQALSRMLQGSTSRAAGEKAVADYLRSDFATSAMNPDGTVNAIRAASWAKNNADVLAQFPQARAEFDNLVAQARRGETLSAEAKASLDAAKRAHNSAGYDFERSAAGTLLREDPRDVATTLVWGNKFSNAKRMQETTDIVRNDPTALRGWRAAVADAVVKKATDIVRIDEGNPVAGGKFAAKLSKLSNLFKDKAQILASVFTPEQMNALRQAHKLLEPLRNLSIKATSDSQTADKMSGFLRYIEVPIRATKGALEGGSIMRKLRILASTLPSDQAAVDRLVSSIWFDPERAQFLLGHKTGIERGPSANYRVKLLNAGAAAARSTGPQGE